MIVPFRGHKATGKPVVGMCVVVWTCVSMMFLCPCLVYVGTCPLHAYVCFVVLRRADVSDPHSDSIHENTESFLVDKP